MLDKLQKIDEDTLELIKRANQLFFRVGIRTDEERTWEIIKELFKLPFKMIIEKNPEIEYQGKGVHLTNKQHPTQVMTIRELGRFELKAVSTRQNNIKRPAIRFKPTKEIQLLAEQKVKVIDSE